MTTEKQEAIKLDVSTPRGALTFLKLTLEGENIQMSGRAFALSQQCLITFAKMIEQNEASAKMSKNLVENDLGNSEPTLKKVQDTESK